MDSEHGRLARHLAFALVVSGVVVAILSTAGVPEAKATSLPDVVLNEVAWGGTAAGSADEWIELYNNTPLSVDVTDWLLQDDNDIHVALSGSIAPHGYFLLERSDNCTVSDVPADRIYTGSLANDGEHLRLLDADGRLVDSVDGSTGWPAGSGSPHFLTMERIDPTAPGEPANWDSNNGLIRNGLDCVGQALNGTPRSRNSTSYADLGVAQYGPLTAPPDAFITYTLVLSNAGQLPAETVRLTDVLPSYVAFQAQDAPFPFSRPEPGTLVWELGTVQTTTASAPLCFSVTGKVDAQAHGELTNAITVTSATAESRPANNQDAWVTVVGEPPGPPILIESLYAHTYGGIDDEAFRLMNVSSTSVALDGWTLSDGEGTVTFPPGTALMPGDRIWCTRHADAFYDAFGFLPAYEWAGGQAAIPDLSYSGSLRFNDDGDNVTLYNAGQQPIDVLIYGEGPLPPSGWSGPALQPYNPTNTFPARGQIYYRKRDERTGWPVLDSDTAADWAQDTAEPIEGRKVQYPGWDLDQFFWTARVTETAVLTIAVGPDHLLETLLAQMNKAEESIWIEGYTFESVVLAQAITEKLAAGVGVTLSLEGAPSGGVAEAQRWICGQVQQAGGRVYFMSGGRFPARYRVQHGKFMLIDRRLALIGSENLNPTSMPADAKGDGTAGRRGVYLITDAPGVVDRIQAIMAADIDPVSHGDILTCADVPDLCSGSPPLPEPEWTSYTVAFAEPLTIRGDLSFEVVQSPENSLRAGDGLLGLVGRAGPGDTILVEEFYEDCHWGSSDATPETDPNPRLEAYLDAARRGARVRILLDSFFDRGDNAATVAYLGTAAGREKLDVEARLANPTGLGLHNKMVLAQIGGRGFVHAGSLNGTEVSSKANREVALQVQSDEAYEYLKAVFDYDWSTTRLLIYLPLLLRAYQAPQPAAHLLIGEVYYPSDPARQWLEIYNPTSQAVDLAPYKIGDAAHAGDYEGMYCFPAGAGIGPAQVLVIAVNTRGFQEAFAGHLPDFELVASNSGVPTLAKYLTWSEGDWWLREAGDEVLLLNGSDAPVDVVAYGDSPYPQVAAHPGVVHGHSLERYPVWLDTDDCGADFRDQPYPSPGSLP
jgi:uncharacterized repeat protein (TIGR01451 family)